MSVSGLCFDVINLLLENIQPMVEFSVNFNNCLCQNDNEFGLICLLQFLEAVRDNNYSIHLKDNQLHEKLVELANQILLIDFGETSTFQNYLFDCVNDICETLKPEHNQHLRVDDLVPAELMSSTSSVETSVMNVFLRDTRPVYPLDQNPIYDSISELLDSVMVVEMASANFTQRVDDILNSLELKNPERCKVAFVRRLKTIKDAINLISKSENNVIYSSFLKLQRDDIYAMLKNDLFYDADNSPLEEGKIIFLQSLRHLRLVAKEKMVKFIAWIKVTFARIKQICAIGCKSTSQVRCDLWVSCKDIFGCVSLYLLVFLNCVACMGALLT